MNMMEFMSGFYSALSLSSGIYFLTSRKLRAPFREAFGWLSVYCAVENLLYFIVENIEFSDILVRRLICLCLDLTIIPILSLLMSCIVDQDIKTTPFRKRWLRVAELEIPIIACICVCGFTQYEWIRLFIDAVIIFNILGVFSYGFYRLCVYEKRLPGDEKGKKASVKWMWWLFMLLVIEFLLYISVGTYISDLTYYFVLIVFTFVATYFINKQSPINTRQIFAAVRNDESANNADSDSEQSGVSRDEMREKTKQFMAKHPKFKAGITGRAKQKLTVRDIFLCIMIIEGKHVDEIAETLAISRTSVEVARYRLRSKLNLNRGENLAKVLKSFL